jgi:hypothetical protein
MTAIVTIAAYVINKALSFSLAPIGTSATTVSFPVALIMCLLK